MGAGLVSIGIPKDSVLKYDVALKTDTTKPSTEDQTKGKLHEVKGAIRQKAGEVTGNPNLEADGRAEKKAGKVQNIAGKIEKAVGE